jgi:UDP-GlcNAc3NAcA epimerase
MKIITILGARPQFIKAAAVSRALNHYKSKIEEIIIHTGQHYDENMSQVFFDEMLIPKPKYNLSMGSLSHGAMTGRMLEGIEKILLDEKPDWVMVYGDTNSTLAGALAASKLHIKIAHIEAGLRSFNMRMPEEVNRILTDRISNLLFVSSNDGKVNLDNEGISKNNFSEVVFSGDVMYDTIVYYKQFAKAPPTSLPSNFALVTIHRQENTDDIPKLKKIVGQLNELHNTIPVVLPLHPRTKKILDNLGIAVQFTCIEPASYFEMIYLLNNCSVVITDSGGLQKEAYFCKKPCVTVRDQTEWVELVQGGANILVNPLTQNIAEISKSILQNRVDYTNQIYGNGKAAEVIAQTFFNKVND